MANIIGTHMAEGRGVKRAMPARHDKKKLARARFWHGISWARHDTARSERARSTKMVRHWHWHWHGTIVGLIGHGTT